MLTPVGSLVFCEAGLSSAQVHDLAFLDGNESSVTGEFKLVSTIRFLPLVFMRPLFSCSSALFPLPLLSRHILLSNPGQSNFHQRSKMAENRHYEAINRARWDERAPVVRAPPLVATRLVQPSHDTDRAP
jgi:hypothetical protein